MRVVSQLNTFFCLIHMRKRLIRLFAGLKVSCGKNRKEVELVRLNNYLEQLEIKTDNNINHFHLSAFFIITVPE